jgi:hypothetical protein
MEVPASRRSTRILLTMLLGAAIGYASWHVVLTRNQPLLEQYAFRQTQTALTSYWFLREGVSLAYQTPVLGDPWRVPFEFPLYQLLVAGVTDVTHVPLDQAGRMLSVGFFLFSLLPLYQLGKSLNLDSAVFLIIGTLFLLSPVCLFWGRGFMIESCGLFLSLMFLASFVSGVRTGHAARRWYWALAAAAFGVLAALTKVTTFAMFFLLAVGTLVYLAGRALVSTAPEQRRSVARSLVRSCWPYVLALVVPLVVTEYWVDFSDHVKTSNPMSAALVSTRLRPWTYGTLEDRLSLQLWRETIWKRAVPESIGLASPLALLGTSLIYLRRRLLALTLTLLVAYVGVFLLFPRLHIVHSYYQYANAPFLVAAAAVGLYAVSTRNRLTFAAVMGFVIIAQVWQFHGFYRERMRAEFTPHNSPTLAVSEALRMRTRPDDVVLVYGYDWSSEIAYYSQRKAIMVPSWWKSPPEILRQADRFTGGNPLGAIVVCSQFRKTAEFEALLQQATAHMAHERRANCDVYVQARTSPG